MLPAPSIPAPAARPSAFYLKNHSATELHRAAVADLPALSTRPAFATKDAFAKWCHDAATSHVFYTLAEPELNTQRSSARNPIKFLHGIVADYDGHAPALQAALPTLAFGPGLAPAWVTTTFSNKVRLLWLFAHPVPVFSPDVLTRFLTALVKALHLKKLGLSGLDEGALISNPHTPYELGTYWHQPYGDTRVPSSLVLTALHDASNRTKWRVDGPVIPLEAVAAEVARRWPGRWPGPFADGARGVRFWDPRADNPTGCTLRTLGVQAWTGECRFIPWAELLGAEFTKQYRVNRIGGAIDGVYHDGQAFWQRDESGDWRAFTAEAMKRRLAVMFGLSTEGRKGEASEVAQTLTTIENVHGVDGAFPCLFVRDDLVRDHRHKYLNISRVVPVTGTGARREWGDGFPWLARYLDGLFGAEQLAVFLAWLAHFHRHAAAGAPRKGQALFVAGPQSAGKTFLSQRVIGALMGGFQEATDYVLGVTTFNESLFYAPVWSVDDAVASADPRRHMVYSQIVKKIVANPYQQFNPKFKKAVTQKFNGRLVVTLNDDAESIAMLPQVEGSILDKIVILRAAAPGVSFAAAEEKTAAELPYLADHLAHYVLPDWLQTRPDEVTRFGHDSWHHPELLQTAREASQSAGLFELLEIWRTYYFRSVDAPEWTGNASELLIEFARTEGLSALVAKTAPSRIVLGRDLAKLVKQGHKWIQSRRTNRGSAYLILRPEGLKKQGRA